MIGQGRRLAALAAATALTLGFAGCGSSGGSGNVSSNTEAKRTEAVKAGLRVNPRTVNQLAWGIQRKNSPFQYVAPDPDAKLHNSLTAA